MRHGTTTSVRSPQAAGFAFRVSYDKAAAVANVAIPTMVTERHGMEAKCSLHFVGLGDVVSDHVSECGHTGHCSQFEHFTDIVQVKKLGRINQDHKGGRLT